MAEVFPDVPHGYLFVFHFQQSEDSVEVGEGFNVPRLVAEQEGLFAVGPATVGCKAALARVVSICVQKTMR